MRYSLVLAACCLLVARHACGDGVMVVKVGQAVDLVETPKQEALMIVDEDVGNITVSLRTHFRAGPKELAWIVPVPAVPGIIKKGNEEVFRALEEETRPRFSVFDSGGFMPGCGTVGGKPAVETAAVEVVKTGTAGIFDYAVLKSDGTEALVDWLNENEYRIPSGSEPVFQRYVDRGWHWLAIRLRAEVQDEPNLAPHPITYTYRDDKVEYPMVISALSAPDEIELLLYVLADREYGGENWANTLIENEELELDDSSPSGTNYERLFRERTAEKGGHLLVTEFASDLDTVGGRSLLARLRGLDFPCEVPSWPGLGPPDYLTRLRAVVKKNALDHDIVLVPTRVSEHSFVSNSYHLWSNERQESTWGVWPLAVVVVLMMAATCYGVRRRRVNRQ